MKQAFKVESNICL